MRIDELDLTVRARNCLDSAQIETVGELVSKSDQDLLSVRSFGRTSLREVKRRLEELGLSLGTPLPDGYEIQISENTGEPIEAVIIED